ncbi:MAG: type II toxin-antitoxin system VapC family toxin [Chitinophagaceae bacterium]|nr:type II toxin-antitoxin system VapC family toxin [Chitinophagaceae bacterium]
MENNKFLVDTHCLIWFQENNPKIPAQVMEKLQNLDNSIYFCQLSLFEITIKQKIGKLPLLESDVSIIHDQAILDKFRFLPLQNAHLSNYSKIPLSPLHRDPFDRLLIATAHHENIPILSADKNFSLYKDFIKVLW